MKEETNRGQTGVVESWRDIFKPWWRNQNSSCHLLSYALIKFFLSQDCAILPLRLCCFLAIQKTEVEAWGLTGTKVSQCAFLKKLPLDSHLNLRTPALAFVLVQCQPHGCQNWQQLVRQGEDAWLLERLSESSHARVTLVKSQQEQKLTEWLTGQGNDRTWIW